LPVTPTLISWRRRCQLFVQWILAVPAYRIAVSLPISTFGETIGSQVTAYQMIRFCWLGGVAQPRLYQYWILVIQYMRHAGSRWSTREHSADTQVAKLRNTWGSWSHLSDGATQGGIWESPKPWYNTSLSALCTSQAHTKVSIQTRSHHENQHCLCFTSEPRKQDSRPLTFVMWVPRLTSYDHDIFLSLLLSFFGEMKMRTREREGLQ